MMQTAIVVGIVIIFMSVALAAGAAMGLLLSRTAPERRRLRTTGGSDGLFVPSPKIAESLTPLDERQTAIVPK